MVRRKACRKVVFDDHMALSYEEVLGVLKYFRLPKQDFDNWMVGQTCPLTNGKIGVYWYDLNRYVQWKLQGKLPIFD